MQCNAFILGDFNTPLTLKNRSIRQKISKDKEAQNNVLEQMDLTDIYRTLHPKATGYTFFSSTWNIFKNRPYTRPQNKKSLSNSERLKLYQPTSQITTNF